MIVGIILGALTLLALSGLVSYISWRYSKILLDGRPYPLGDEARISPASIGLRYTEVRVPTKLGGAPAWFVPTRTTSEPWQVPPSNTWVILVHGRGGSRLGSLDLLAPLQRFGHPTLTITYRNDDGAPASPDGLSHLGDTEWEDVEAAIEYALDAGAEDVALFARSQGGALVGQVLARSALAKYVSAVILDCPVLDWRTVLHQAARAYRLPRFIAVLAMWIAQWRIGIDFKRFDLVNSPPARQPPTLIFHGVLDSTVPIKTSQALAAKQAGGPWTVHLVQTEGEHNECRSDDRRRYDSLVSHWLYHPDNVVAGVTALGGARQGDG